MADLEDLGVKIEQSVLNQIGHESVNLQSEELPPPTEAEATLIDEMLAFIKTHEPDDNTKIATGLRRMIRRESDIGELYEADFHLYRIK